MVAWPANIMVKNTILWTVFICLFIIIFIGCDGYLNSDSSAASL